MKIVSRCLPKGLQPYIKHMWIIEEGGAADISIKSFPVGYAFLNVINGNKFKVIKDGRENYFSSYLAGPQSSFYDLKMGFIQRALTIQLQPFALPYLFDRPASEFAGEILELRDIDAILSERLEEFVCSDFDSNKVLTKVEELLMGTIWFNQQEPRIQAALQMLLVNGGKMKIHDLANRLNVSQRRVQQLFKEYFGLTAKGYSRIIRMQHHTFQLLNGRNVDEVIPQGYYDQAHFIHELKKQTGMLPKDFFDYICNEDRKGAYINSSLYRDFQ